MKTVYDLTAEELEELRFTYMTQLEEIGEGPDNIDDISDEDLFYQYDGFMFCDDDFFCNNPAKGVRPF